ncbi:phospholipid:diacylglycerol acyltransferase, partial [Coemansia sp. RSA 2703]
MTQSKDKGNTGGNQTARQRKGKNKRSKGKGAQNDAKHVFDEEEHPGTPTATGTHHNESDANAGTPTEREKKVANAVLKKTLGKELAELKPGRVKRRRWFISGIVIGVAAALSGILYTNPTQSPHINHIHQVLGEFDVTSLLPESLMPEDFIRDVSKLLSLDGFGTESAANYTTGDFQPALTLVKEEGLKKKHNVILIPGIISSGLESWSTADCSRPYFRQRLWGTSTMFKAILLDKECWVQHMMLDKKTGLDPPGIKLRAAKGLDAADYFITGYWIWGKIIENLAVLG